MKQLRIVMRDISALGLYAIIVYLDEEIIWCEFRDNYTQAKELLDLILARVKEKYGPCYTFNLN